MTFDKEKYERLKDKYAEALSEEKPQFEFEGQELLTGYAKYIIDYLSSKFEPKEKSNG